MKKILVAIFGFGLTITNSIVIVGCTPQKPQAYNLNSIDWLFQPHMSKADVLDQISDELSTLSEEASLDQVEVKVFDEFDRQIKFDDNYKTFYEHGIWIIPSQEKTIFSGNAIGEIVDKRFDLNKCKKFLDENLVLNSTKEDIETLIEVYLKDEVNKEIKLKEDFQLKLFNTKEDGPLIEGSILQLKANLKSHFLRGQLGTWTEQYKYKFKFQKINIEDFKNAFENQLKSNMDEFAVMGEIKDILGDKLNSKVKNLNKNWIKDNKIIQIKVEPNTKLLKSIKIESSSSPYFKGEFLKEFDK